MARGSVPFFSSTRAVRGVALAHQRGTEIVLGEYLADEGEELWSVPGSSEDGQYTVTLRGLYDQRFDYRESCECPDHLNREVTCKHIHAVKVIRARLFRRNPKSGRELCNGLAISRHQRAALRAASDKQERREGREFSQYQIERWVEAFYLPFYRMDLARIMPDQWEAYHREIEAERGGM